MDIRTQGLLAHYLSACVELSREFIELYYRDVEIFSHYWVGDEVGTIFCINDDFWDMRTMRIAMERGISVDKLFEWYDTQCEEESPYYGISLDNYLKVN